MIAFTAPKVIPGEPIVIACLLVPLIVTVDLLFYPKTLEDAFITFRYSKHLGEGYGFGSWNIAGECVEGYTSFLWMVLLAAAKPLHVQITTLGKLLGIASHLLLSLLFLLFPLIKHSNPAPADTPLGRHHDVFVYASVILGLYLPISWYSTSGMETVSFIFLVALVLLFPFVTEKVIPLSIVSIALVLMRPEGILFAIACNGFQFFRRRVAGINAFSILLPGIAALIAYVAQTVHRAFTFGEILPNTFYAKASGAEHLHIILGLKYIRGWINNHEPFGLLLLIAAFCCIASLKTKGFRKNAFFLFLIGFVMVYIAYIVRVGGDNYCSFPFWRHILHLMPFLALLLSTALVNVVPSSWRSARLYLLVAILAVTNYISLTVEPMFDNARQGLMTFPALVDAPHNYYYVWLSRIASPNTIIASSLGGELPFVVDAIHIDILGLNDRYIAYHGQFDPLGPIDSKTDMSYVLGRSPDIIEGYLNARAIVAGRPRVEILGFYRRQMSLGLIENPIFKSDYLFLVNGPYRHLNRALFLRRSYWERHPLRRELHCVPVSSTTLYQQ